MGSPLWTILVCKIPEFEGEGFEIRILSRSIQETYTLRKAKKTGFNFSTNLRTKFV